MRTRGGGYFQQAIVLAIGGMRQQRGNFADDPQKSLGRGVRTAIYPELYHHKVHIYRPQSLGGGDGGVIFDSVDCLARVLVVDSARTPQQANRNQISNWAPAPALSACCSVRAAEAVRPLQVARHAAAGPAAQRRNRDKALSLELRLHHPWQSEQCQRGTGRTGSSTIQRFTRDAAAASLNDR